MGCIPTFCLMLQTCSPDFWLEAARPPHTTGWCGPSFRTLSSVELSTSSEGVYHCGLSACQITLLHAACSMSTRVPEPSSPPVMHGQGLIALPSVAQVPLKRVNQAYVIATSTKVDLKGSDVSKLEDSHFKAAEKPKEKKGEEGFFKKDTEPEEKVSSKSAALLMSSRFSIMDFVVAMDQ